MLVAKFVLQTYCLFLLYSSKICDLCVGFREISINGAPPSAASDLYLNYNYGGDNAPPQKSGLHATPR